MEHTRYLDLIRADSDRLLAVVQQGPDNAVPSCPGWTNHDLLRHVGEVYDHKILCMRLGRAPEKAERAPHAADAAALPAWFVSLRDALLDQLVVRGPGATSHTWFPPDQTVGFWYRRMAHETAVHRVDAELACGQETPIDAELAVDGVDELLGFLTHDFGDRTEQHQGVDRTVALGCGGRQWAVTLRKDHVERAPEGAVPDARIDGEPGDLLLHLWGRRQADKGSLTSSGDVAALGGLWVRLREETQ
ncbi:maleylpyruvate isomerase family mycothiol-dependent enzyme [Streptosporangium sp. NPDC051023]|uniref:maleylpyruvate isomerase family mycothiol-dependent enzyme n=1 Tax=Streptosporangium sp. NPDC051023 TaxID=3155410 RepID=UPI00344CBEB3